MITDRPCQDFVRTIRLLLVAAFTLAVLLGMSPVLFAQSYNVDAAASQALTAYLREYRLPLVGAQVLSDAAGNRRIVLYGFVATELGKNDATRKALAYLKAKDIPAENRIEVRPEIARMKSDRAAATQAADSGNESIDQVLDDIDRYGVSIPAAERNPSP